MNRAAKSENISLINYLRSIAFVLLARKGIQQVIGMIKRFPRNQRGRDLLIGDIHGNFDKAMESLKAVGFDPMFDRVFGLGDMVDRGPQSEQALSWLAQPWFHSVMGNHEWFHVAELDAPFRLANGGAWFLSMPELARLDFQSAFASLPIAIELETDDGLVVLVHADIGSPGWARTKELLMQPDVHPGVLANCIEGRVRFDFLDGGGVPDVRAVVVGHNPVERITNLANVIYIDTGAWKPDNATKPFAILDASTLEQAYDPARGLWGDGHA